MSGCYVHPSAISYNMLTDYHTDGHETGATKCNDVSADAKLMNALTTLTNQYKKQIQRATLKTKLSDDKLQATNDEKLQATSDDKLQATNDDKPQATSDEKLQATNDEKLQATSDDKLQATNKTEYDEYYKRYEIYVPKKDAELSDINNIQKVLDPLLYSNDVSWSDMFFERFLELCDPKRNSGPIGVYCIEGVLKMINISEKVMRGNEEYTLSPVLEEMNKFATLVKNTDMMKMIDDLKTSQMKGYYKISPNRLDNLLLRQLCKYGYTDQAIYLLKLDDSWHIDVTDNYNESMFHARENKQYELLKMLINHYSYNNKNKEDDDYTSLVVKDPSTGIDVEGFFNSISEKV